jgi:hypothetical protein
MRSANYVEETTTSIAGTAGNGAITLTAVSGLPRFSNAFGTQNTQVRYIIEDTVNKTMETGIGNVSSNVLTRSSPQITWNGTTYADAAPAALAFGATPTAGDIKIRLAATAEHAMNSLTGTNTTITGAFSAWQEYRPSAAFPIVPGSTRLLVAAREYYNSYLLPNGGLLDGAQIQVMTAVVSSGLKMSLHPVLRNGLPGSKIVDFGVFDTATTGIKTRSDPSLWAPAGAVWLTPGWYFVGYIPSHAIAINGTSGTVNTSGMPLGFSNTYGQTDTIHINGNYTTGIPNSPAPTTLAPVNGAEARHTIGLRVRS